MEKKIVEIYTLEIEDMQILVGTDIITRELYFYIESKGKIIPVSEEVKHKIISEFESSKVPTVLKEFIENTGKKYLKNNSNYGFSSSTMQSNLQNLHVEYKECDLQKSLASYEAFSNTISIRLPRGYLEKMSIYWKSNLILLQIIAHEIGHLSVSEIKLDNTGNVIIVAIGFLQAKIPISESFKTIDGNDYYRLDNSKKFENEGRGLEELFNALKVDEITNSATSPNFAHRLNRITEGKLHNARQNHSLEDYYEVMESIMPSYDKAKLLLLGIEAYYKASDGNDKELFDQLSNMIEQLIDDYEMCFLSSKSQNKGVHLNGC